METDGLKIMSFDIEWLVIINTKTCNIFETSRYGLNRMKLSLF